MRKITCMCESSFEADLPERIDLDAEPERLDEILSGDFFALTCPSCGNRIKPEFDVDFVSVKRGIRFHVLPEIERLSFYLGETAVPRDTEVLIGYVELYERARMLRDGLDPETIEVLKYYLRLKAEETVPEGSELGISYAGLSDEGPGQSRALVFHIKGLKADEVAVLPLARAQYERTLGDKEKIRKNEPFDRIFKGQYRSIRILETENDQD